MTCSPEFNLSQPEQSNHSVSEWFSGDPTRLDLADEISYPKEKVEGAFSLK